MSRYNRPPPPPAYDDDILESLQNIPSNFDLALNGGTNRTYLAPGHGQATLQPPHHQQHPSLGKDAGDTDDALRRLSFSTVSSLGIHSRHPSPLRPTPANARNHTRTWRSSTAAFWQRNQGLFLVSISQLFGALMNVTTRLLELEGEGMQPFQVLFARMFLTMGFCGAWMWWKGVRDFPLGAKGTRWLLVARGCSGFFGIFGMYYSLQYLPVADAVVITFLAPSVASYACYLFLREPFPRSAQYASLISLLGVILIARPTSFFSSSSSPSIPTGAIEVSPITNTTASSPALDANFPVPTSAQRLSAVAVAMLGVLGSAGAFTSIRWIGARAHPLISVNYFAVTCTIVSTLALTLSRPLHISDLHFALPSGLRQWGMLLFLGVCGFVMQFLLTKGLAAGGRGNGARATNMVYTNMLFALALDKWVFGQSPGWWSIAGSGLILGSAVYVGVVREKVAVGDGGEGGLDRDAERGEAGEEGIGMLEREREENEEGLESGRLERGRSLDLER